ncbi:MAG TPA: DUF4160 domain-containing protein [Tepidisphaeraceae bacterium]|nr:DUF4160 domain-containing protein [Tepidisphaeraceae bacterium]
MPKALKHGPYRFFFWSREPNEPPHVHVQRERFEAKFWIDPVVELAQNWGFARHELNRVGRIIEARRTMLLEKWHEHFDET